MTLRVIACAAALAVAGNAAADLYLWRDPATGQVRIHSYPPPWYGNPELERRSPKVERMPERQRAPVVAQPETPAIPPAAASAAYAPPPPPVGDIAKMETRRRQLLQQIVVAGAKGMDRPAPEMDKVVDEYLRLLLDMARVDPGGADSRRAETQEVIDKIKGKVP
ncbi:MAG: hypothetical protein ACT4P9_05350 [Betaproteobacteria bacterium]